MIAVPHYTTTPPIVSCASLTYQQENNARVVQAADCHPANSTVMRTHVVSSLPSYLLDFLMTLLLIGGIALTMQAY